MNHQKSSVNKESGALDKNPAGVETKEHFVAVFDVIAERKLAEKRQELSTEIMIILNDSSSFVDAINRILKAIKRATGFDAIGIRLGSGDDFPYYAQDGFSNDFLLTENTLTERTTDEAVCKTKNGDIALNCTCGLVLSGQTDPENPLFTKGGSFWTNNSASLLDLPADRDQRHHPRNRCIHEGFQSFALIPIHANRAIVGLLQLNNRNKNSFTIDTIRFFEGLGASIGVALKRKDAEELLRESEGRIRSITDATRDAILMMDPAGNVSFWNPAAEQILGYTRAEAMGQNLHALIVPERFHNAHHAAFPAFLRTGQGGAIGKTLDLAAIRKDGKEISVQLSLSAIRMNGAWNAVGIIRDITERKQAEDALRESEEKFRSYVENSPDGIFLVDETGRYLEVNNAACINTGYSKEEICTKTIADLLAEEFLEKGLNHFKNLLEKGATTGEIIYKHKDGSRHYWILSAVKISEKRFLGFSKNIDARKQAEFSLEKEKKSAETASKAKSIFLSNMSHEIRTPLNGIIGFCDLLLDSGLTDEQRGFTEPLQSCSNTLLTLINDILDLSKIEANKITLEIIDFDLRAVLKDLEAEFRLRVAQKGLALTFQVGSRVTSLVKGDPSRLGQIIRNLIGNAVKFTEKGAVLCSVDQENEDDESVELRFTIQDTGIGISAETASRLFSPFEQGDTSMSRKFGGTGLGLAISRQLAEKMGGRMWVESALGYGSVFRFTIKAAKQPVMGGAGPEHITGPIGKADNTESRQAQPADAVVRRSGFRILVAEDNLENQTLANAFLKKLGYRADIVPNGAEALKALRSNKYDLVLMDCMMPEMDGFMATRAIRETRNKDFDFAIPIVAMTANATKEDQVECLKAGMNDYLSKPLKSTKLAETLDRWLSKKEIAGGDIR